MTEQYDKITKYFNEFVMPLLCSEYGDILPKMSIMILGSVGLGNDDELSDLEVGIYLGDSDWKQFGKVIQLSLKELLRNNNPWQEKGSILCVHPTSWLLDGQAHKFFESTDNPPWEDVSFETLFTVQNNLIVFDPHEILQKLRDKTAPANRPDKLWRKSLITELKNIIEELHELEDSVLRNEAAEAFGSFGRIIEELYRIGFIASRSYYPWRSHLSWAFEKLPLASDFKRLIDGALAADTWQKRLEYIKNVTDAYKECIKANNLLPEIDLNALSLNDELTWAERLKAWEKGRYRRWDKRYSEQFKSNRLEYIQSHKYSERVFVHGDLCGDNILLTSQGELYIIDFADAVLAPKVYEHALVAVELFDLDPALLQGYFGSCSVDELTQICFDGLLIHDFGGDVVEQHIGKPDEFQGLDALRKRLKQKIEGVLKS